MNALQLAGLRAREWIQSDCVIYDCESSGLGSKDVAVDICVLAPDGRVLLESLVQLAPDVQMGEKAQQIHGIRPEVLLKEGVPFPQLMPALADIFARHTVVAFNADFDSRILTQTCTAWYQDARLSGLTVWNCAMLLSQNAMQVRKWPRQSEAADHFNVKALGQHRARVDAEVARQILLRIAGVL